MSALDFIPWALLGAALGTALGIGFLRVRQWLHDKLMDYLVRSARRARTPTGGIEE